MLRSLVSVELGFAVLVTSIGLLGCAHGIARYQNLIQPKVGVAKKPEMDQLFGPPAFCKPIKDWERCEYRPPREGERKIPDAYRKEPGFGPDLSPYDRFDVLQLSFDDGGVLREWEPIVIRP